MVTKPDCNCVTLVEMALHDWELSGYEEDWWGSYQSIEENAQHVVDIHIDLMPDPDEPEQMRRTLSVYPVIRNGVYGHIDTNIIIHRQVVDTKND